MAYYPAALKRGGLRISGCVTNMVLKGWSVGRIYEGRTAGIGEGDNEGLYT